MDTFRNGDGRVVMVCSNEEAAVLFHLLRESGSFNAATSKLRDNMIVAAQEFARQEEAGKRV